MSLINYTFSLHRMVYRKKKKKKKTFYYDFLTDSSGQDHYSL